MRTRKKRAARRAAVLAAALILLAAFGITALAFNMFGLRDFLFPDRQPVSKLDENGMMLSGENVYVDMISLSGYAESPAAKAHADWQEFLNGYDVEGAAKAYDEETMRTGQANPELEKYDGYDVYDLVMAARLEEILTKYGLNLRGKEHTIETREELISRTGGDFTGTCQTSSGYLYDDGTCFFEGESGTGKNIAFQFFRAVKASFNDVSLNVFDAADYEQWIYQTACGEQALLCLGSTRSLIFCDFPDCFISLNVLSGRDGSQAGGDAIDRKDLKALADELDFSLLHRNMKSYNFETYGCLT